MLIENMYYQSRSNFFAGAVKKLIFINLIIFIFQQIMHIWFGSIFLEKYFALSHENLKQGYLWTLFTYGFLHGNFLHILVNMLAIYFVGRIIEATIGSKILLIIYFVCLLCGALSWLLLTQGSQQVLIGASAAGFGLMTFFCLMFPEKPITVLLFFIIPLTMKPKWILRGMLAIEAFLYFFYELPGKSFIASSGHLGGILGGFIMYQILIGKWHDLLNLKKIKMSPPKWLQKTQSPKVSNAKFTVNISHEKVTTEEVNRILDKINQHGFASLTNEEKRTLNKAKETLR